MLGYIKGKIQAKTEKNLIIETGGVGYAVFVPQNLIQQVKLGDQLELYLHTHVREDALELYGLPRLEELEFFKKLIGVSGVGPKTALGLFEAARLDEIKKAITHGDSGILTKVSGIGKKTAELIILKLRDKAGDYNLSVDGEMIGSSGEAIEALIALGYSVADAREALAKLSPDLVTTEDKVRAVLKSTR